MLYLLANIILYNMVKNRKSKKKVTSESDLSSATVKGSEDMINVCPSRVCSLNFICASLVMHSLYTYS